MPWRDGFVEPGRHGLIHGLAGVDARGDGLIELDRLFARAAMHVAQDVDGRCHCVVQAHAAGRGHARDRDARRLRAVVDRGHQRRVQQEGLARRRQLAPRHQPDHLRQAHLGRSTASMG